MAGSILHMDPPEHAAWRRTLNREFTARAVERMEADIRALTSELLDAVPPGEVVDLVDVLAAPLPVLVICELLGVPDVDRDRLPPVVRRDDPRHGRACRAPRRTRSRRDGAGGVPRAARRRQAGEPRRRHRVAPRRGGGRRPAPHGRPSSSRSTCRCWSRATRPTRHLISGGMMALAEHPDQRALLAAATALDPARGRGVPPLGHADPAVRPHRDAPTPRSATSTSTKATTSSCCTPPGTATKPRSDRPRTSSLATRPGRGAEPRRSDSVSTCASARRSPGSKPASCSRSSLARFPHYEIAGEAE